MFGKTIAIAVSALFALTAAASAQSPKRIQQFDAWGAYSYDSNGGKVCYVLSVPTVKTPTDVNHGDIFFLISQRPGQNISYEPQAMMGYPLKDASKVESNGRWQKFTLFKRRSHALERILVGGASAAS